MAIEVKVPVLPESVTDATVSTWHKKPGDKVTRGENLVDIETDKVMLEVPAPVDGVLGTILQAQGSTVTASAVLATIEEGAGAAAVPAEKPSEPKQVEAAPQATKNVAAGPAVRRVAAEHGVDVSTIAGTGKDGRVTKADVLTPAKPSAAPAQAMGVREEKRVPMTRLRARIAERLLAAQHQAAILTTFNEVNLQAVVEVRDRYKDQFTKIHGIKLGFMSFFVKAAVEALKRFPIVNASIDGTEVIYHGYFDIGVAVSTERGLVVPIIRDADTLSLADIEKAIVSYGEKARDNKLTVEEMTGGTFTISNGGVFGSLLSTPIINPPQSAILGMHNIQ
ncbi:MAG TPA: 2-oxoglutarate dehydrogenase complex dihydrolipoyllysine-residue succinyltransferase, partial [Gammaproteobacteria bacterium]|nr:2-oxoglutarate dehydrogenase complex dihydrolipoyllysine-residue succinyltransferase [Gammaproteobacteria bacterium]